MDDEIETIVNNTEIEIVTKDMVKEDNIECCVCLNFHWGVKLPNCNHFICHKCYYIMYYGYISHEFYTNNPKPIYPKNPTYPYLNISQNTEIYDTLTSDDTYKEWFINGNEDLYNCVKAKSELVDDNLLHWFQNNEVIKKYENDLIQNKFEWEEYYDKWIVYSELLEEENENNIQNTCPLCRL